MIKDRIQSSIDVKTKILNNTQLIETIERIAKVITSAYQNDKKVLFCGNGGSAADAQHLAAELSGRFYFDRPPLAAEACHVNTSFITAVSNDYGYDYIYSRYIKSTAKQGDVIIGLSTSGNSVNVVNALKVANEIGMTTVSFTGDSGGEMSTISQYLVNVPSNDTPRIQETHILVGHIICELVEKNLFSND